MFIGRANECIEKEKKDEAVSSGCITMKRKERLSMVFEKKKWPHITNKRRSIKQVYRWKNSNDKSVKNNSILFRFGDLMRSYINKSVV